MKLRLSRVVIFCLLIVAALIPAVLWNAKYINNPSEFKKETAHYATVVMKVLHNKAFFDRIKVGDVRYDGNGEDIMRVMSISKLEPNIIGKASLKNGDHVDIVDENNFIFYLTLHVRYHKVGDTLYVHGAGSVLGENYLIDFSTAKYTVSGNIAQVVENKKQE